MSALTKIMTGAAGLAALAGVASPAAAQYGYPGYGSQYGYGNNNGLGVVGAIIGALGGNYGQYRYGNYGYGQTNDRSAVSQCTGAVQSRLSNYSARSYGYGNNGYGYGNNAYGNGGYGNNAYGNNAYANTGAQIAGITRIEHRGNGTTKVYGVAMSNAAYSGYNQGYGNNGYNQGYGNNQGYGYNQGYNQGYGTNGYNQSYGNGSANPDISFDCKVDRYGRVVDVHVNRMSRYDQGNYYYGNRPGY